MLLCPVPVTADGCRLDRGEVWSPWDSSQLSLLRLQQAQRVCVWAGGPASLHSQTHCCLEPGVRPRAEGVPLRLHSAPQLRASPSFPRPSYRADGHSLAPMQGPRVEVSLVSPALPSDDSRPCLCLRDGVFPHSRPAPNLCHQLTGGLWNRGG